MKQKIIDIDPLINKIKKFPSIQILNSKNKIEFEKFLKKYYFKDFRKIKFLIKKLI